MALKTLNPAVAVYALRSNNSSKNIEGVINCYNLSEVPLDVRFVIISNPTSLHLKTIQEVVRLKVPLFIEKPPVQSLVQAEELKNVIKLIEVPSYTAFNLRFHPVIKWLKENISAFRVIEVNVYCGSYLPSWRPEQDYRKVYSARKELGGGVHLDLTHEIDYLLWIFGQPCNVKSSKRRISDLEISSVDCAKYWLDYEEFSVNVNLNYYRRDPKRTIEIVTGETTLECDLISSRIVDLMSQKLIFQSQANIDTYIDQMKYYMDCINSKKAPMNSLQEALTTLEVCLTTC